MSRVSTLLTKTAFVAGVISLSVFSPDIALAQCSQINQQCLAARQDVALCFSNPDPGHEQAIKSVENAIVTSA
jgi:hypothetical protein